jgi:hypothetical protein
VGRSGYGLFGVFSQHFLWRTQKTTINLCQYSQLPSRELDLPEYKAGLLPIDSGFTNCMIKINKNNENEDCKLTTEQYKRTENNNITRHAMYISASVHVTTATVEKYSECMSVGSVI